MFIRVCCYFSVKSDVINYYYEECFFHRVFGGGGICLYIKRVRCVRLKWSTTRFSSPLSLNVHLSQLKKRDMSNNWASFAQFQKSFNLSRCLPFCQKPFSPPPFLPSKRLGLYCIYGRGRIDRRALTLLLFFFYIFLSSFSPFFFSFFLYYITLFPTFIFSSFHSSPPLLQTGREDPSIYFSRFCNSISSRLHHE
jgi:hypothetical protein